MMRHVLSRLAMLVLWVGCNDTHGQPQLLRTHLGAIDPATASLPELAAPAAVAVARAAYVVQFSGAVQPTWIDAVRASGAEARGYFPDNAWSVTGTPEQLRVVQALPFVRAVVRAPAALRVDARLLAQKGDGVAVAVTEPTVLRVELANADAAAAVMQAIVDAGGELVDNSSPIILRARLDAAGVAAVAAHPDVVSISPVVRHHVLNDLEYGILQADVLHRSPMWDHGLQGQHVLVGIADSGIDAASCRFVGSKLLRVEPYAYSGTPPPLVMLHGTHVAGIVAGDLNGDGVYQAEDGEAFAAQIYFTNIGDPNDKQGESLDVPDDLGQLYAGTYAAGARIQSNSWGASYGTYDAQVRSLDAYVASHPDLAIFFANGNDGSAQNTVDNPGSAKNVISVGSLNATAPEDVSSYSSHGPTADGRIKPTVVTPGENVISVDYASACGFRTLSGTSMATPAAAAAGAIVRQYYVSGFYPSGAASAADTLAPSAALIKATLIASTDNMKGNLTDGDMPAYGQGFGRVELDRALHFAGSTETLYVHDSNVALAQGGHFAAQFALLGASRLRAVLVWSDPPATAGASVALVNDLDLVVSGPGGTYAGNSTQGGESSDGGSADRLNVEEVVNLSAAPPGAYTVTVAAHNVPTGSQAFALVVVGSFAQRPQAGGTVAAAAGATAPTGFGSPVGATAKAGTQAIGEVPGYVDVGSAGCASAPAAAPVAAMALLAAGAGAGAGARRRRRDGGRAGGGGRGCCP